MGAIVRLILAGVLALGIGVLPAVSRTHLRPMPHLRIGDMYGFPDSTTVCLTRTDFDLLIKSVKDGFAESGYHAAKTCDTIPAVNKKGPLLPHLILTKKIDEVTMPNGNSYWMLQAESLDHKIVLYVALPAAWFAPGEREILE